MGQEKKRRNWKDSTRFMRFLKPYRARFAVGFVFLILSSLTAMLFPYFLGQLIGRDGGLAEASDLRMESIQTIIIALFAVFIAQAIFSFFRIVLFTQVTELSLRDIREQAFARLVSAPMAYFNSQKVGELTSRIATDINQLQTTFTTTIAEFIRQIITIIVGIAALLWLSPKLALVMLSIIPAVAIVAVIFGRYIRKLSKKTQDAAAVSNSILEEALQGIQSVKAFTNEMLEMGRFGKAIDEIKVLATKGAVWRGLFASFIILVLFGSIVVVIWQGVLLTEKGELLQSSFVSFIMYTIFLGASIGSLPDLYSNIQKSAGATENLMEILEIDTEQISAANRADRAQGDIAFKGVHFTYPSRADLPVIGDLSFSVKQGEQLAIVGPSGAGKSTLVALLLRFYQPNKGKILLDGSDAASFDLSAYRGQFAVVPQEVLLFNGSIRENIAYGDPQSDFESVKNAARQANALEFIERFPEGFETLVGERGVQLSGGQRQRIAIARAVLRDPSVLILDEATSALDSESEQLVQEALERLMNGRTSIVIAHRLSTVRNADRILVLENGKMVEFGSHDELMRQADGLYHRLQSLQQLEA